MEGEGAEGEGAEGSGGSSSEAPRPRGVKVTAEPGRYREVAISIEAHGPGAVRLSPVVRVERAVGEGFEQAAELSLRADCATQAPECVELAPGAELVPPPWTGALGDAQCACDDCSPAPRGRYRFVVTTCEGGHRVESEPFTLGR